jgi:transcriptional regulator with XRE-family HTH domain
MYLSKNLRYLRGKDGRKSQGKLAEELGITRSALSSYEDARAEPKLALLTEMSRFFDVTVDELINTDLTKVTELEEVVKQSRRHYSSGAELRVLTVTHDDDGEEWIELVPEKAAAGYTAGYGDQEYISDLPKYKLPFLSNEKSYRAFEIKGDSMLPLQPKSIVIGEYMQDWAAVRDGEVCVVTSKTEGIVLKKVYNQVEMNGTMLLKSTNISYSPYELPVEDIIDMWKFSAYISRSFPEEAQSSITDLRDAFERLESDVQALKQQQNV